MANRHDRLFELNLEVPFTLEEWLAFGPIREMTRPREAASPHAPLRLKRTSRYTAAVITILVMLFLGYLRLA